MSPKVFERGDAADAADRERPPLTHREVTAEETAAERARVPQNDLGTRPGDLHSGDRLPRQAAAETPEPTPAKKRRAPAKRKR